MDDIINDSETLKRIKESEEDIKKGRIKEIKNVKDMLKELDQLP